MGTVSTENDNATCVHLQIPKTHYDNINLVACGRWISSWKCPMNPRNIFLKVQFPLEINGKCYLKLSFSPSLESAMIYHRQEKLDTNVIFLSVATEEGEIDTRIPRVVIQGRNDDMWD